MLLALLSLESDEVAVLKQKIPAKQYLKITTNIY